MGIDILDGDDGHAGHRSQGAGRLECGRTRRMQTDDLVTGLNLSIANVSVLTCFNMARAESGSPRRVRSNMVISSRTENNWGADGLSWRASSAAMVVSRAHSRV
ncbi:MAG TPA: hypothetical protein VGM14_05745, partial [Streptosporangiaceae bacterium]